VQFDASLHKDFPVTEREETTVGVEVYNRFCATRSSRSTPPIAEAAIDPKLEAVMVRITREETRVRGGPLAYRLAGLGAVDAGMANLAASIRTFGSISLSCVVDCPSVHVTVQRNGILTPAISR
jgi:hypothetical protein